MEEALAGLNEQQREAVLHGEGPLLVVAGAGTGKTTVITTRIAHLIASGKAKPEEVLALTFTEKAAREMEQRLYDLIGWQSFAVPVMTFNAFGAELLGRFASHIGRSIRGGLLKDSQKSLLLRQHIGEVDLKYYGPQSDWMEFLDGIVDYIGRLQNAGITDGVYRKFVTDLRGNNAGLNPLEIEEQADLCKLFELYESLKSKTGTYDYSDQLALPLNILQQRPNLTERLRNEFKYVLVDEYQDTNAVQDRLLRVIVEPGGNIFAVGDDDQAIYGFRGAEIANILSFAEHFGTAQPAVLARNYRSQQPILDAAYRLIRHNDPDRLEHRLGISKRLDGMGKAGVVTFTSYENQVEERQAVVEAVQSRIAGGESPDSIAILSTRHAALAAVAKELRSRKIPFAVSTVVNIFEQPELISLWYLLRWVAWQIDETALAHVVVGPFVGWRASDYRRVQELARESLSSFEAALEADDAQQSKDLAKRVAQWREWGRSMPVSRLAFKLVFDTGMADKWQREALDKPRMVKVFEDLQRWFEQMQDFESVEIDTTVYEYCRQYQRPPLVEALEPVGDDKGVQLLTVHAAKGLEFDTVFLIGCSRRNWTANRGGGGPEVPEGLRADTAFAPEHEFRRLMYVAATRARNNLLLSAPLHTASGLAEPVSGLVTELMGEAGLVTEGRKRSAKAAETAVSKLQRFYPLAWAQDKAAPLPFERPDGWLELSVTALAGYNWCPFDFYLEHVLKIQQPIGPQLSFGTVLHKVFEVYLKDKLAGQTRDTREYHSLLDSLWTDRGYEERQDAERDRQLADQTLQKWLKREKTATSAVIGSEVKMGLVLPSAQLRLAGKIDALLDNAGEIEIRDFKTGRTRTNDDKVAAAAKINFQLRTYALAYQQHHGEPPATVTLDYVVTGALGSASLSPAILRNHEQKLVELAQRLRQRDFAPNLNSLHTCAAVRYYGTGEQEEQQVEAAPAAEGKK